MSDFETFWAAYPRRQSKGAARTAFDKAIRKTTLQTMLTAIDAYVRHKPAYQDFKHPSTWLNQECWDDEWEVPAAPQRPHNEILDAIIRGENVSPRTTTTIDASYERSDGGSSPGPVRLYAVSSGR
jgi:hypothetical protein